MSALRLHTSGTIDIYSAQTDIEHDLPLLEGVRAGFPSPAADFGELPLDNLI
jgi:DNA polymerase V